MRAAGISIYAENAAIDRPIERQRLGGRIHFPLLPSLTGIQAARVAAWTYGVRYERTVTGGLKVAGPSALSTPSTRKGWRGVSVRVR